MRLKRRTATGLLLLWLLLMVGAASAQIVVEGERCNIPAGTVVAGDVFVLCGELTIAGHVEGHVIGGVRTAVLAPEGRVDGSIYLVGGQFDVYGAVGRDIHFGGLVLNVHSEAAFEGGGGLLAANLSSTIDAGTAVPGSVINLGYQLIINGDVGRAVNFWGAALRVSGHVAGNIDATVGDSESDGVSTQIERLLLPFRFVNVELVDPGLIVSETGVISGQLQYRGPTAGVIAGQLEQPEIFRPTRSDPIIGDTPEETARGLRIYFASVLDEFTTLAFIGIAGLLLFPRAMQIPLRTMQMRPLSTLGVGMLSFILSFPSFLAIMVISIMIVLILRFFALDQIALIGGAVLALANIGIAGLFYFTAIYIARVIVGFAAGRFILRLLGRDNGSPRVLLLSMGLGLFLLSMAGAIPVLGWGFDALALFLGLGGIMTVLRAQFKEFREAGIKEAGRTAPVLRQAGDQLIIFPYYDGMDETLAPPLLEEGAAPIGLDDLPPGFEWWDDD